MFPRYFSGEITNWPRLPCYSLLYSVRLTRSLGLLAGRLAIHHNAFPGSCFPQTVQGRERI